MMQSCVVLPKKVLVLFSGPYARDDSLGACRRQHGFEVVMVDNDAECGGDAAHDLANTAFYEGLLLQARGGEFSAVVAAPPCSTFSIASFRYVRAPRVVRPQTTRYLMLCRYRESTRQLKDVGSHPIHVRVRVQKCPCVCPPNRTTHPHTLV